MKITLNYYIHYKKNY